MAPSELALSFDEDPEAYDRARPSYPDRLFDDLVVLADLGPAPRVLEVGPGTGIATRALLGRGAVVTGVEPGRGLGGFLRARFRGEPSFSLVESDLEHAELEAASFDLVCSFTAWHWVDVSAREPLAARLLGPGGHLAVVSTHHVRDGAEDFARAVQACYERFDPDTQKGFVLPSIGETTRSHLDGPSFTEPVLRRYEVDHRYSAQSYVELLRTYSGPRSLEKAAREALFSCIFDLITRDFSGYVDKRYLFELLVATKSG